MLKKTETDFHHVLKYCLQIGCDLFIMAKFYAFLFGLVLEGFLYCSNHYPTS